MRTSKIQSHKLGTDNWQSKDGLTLLVLKIIYQAKQDIQGNSAHSQSARKFFMSDWYKFLIDYLACAMPDFDPEEYFLPEGVEL